jgi:hypothetical protein
MWNNDARQWAKWILLTGLAVVGLVMLGMRLRSMPQMGTEPRVFKTVDALFTAITSHDEVRLEECDKRLHSYREADQLPRKAALFLDGVIAEAKAGKWQSAGRTLYDFMLQQRR